MSKNLTIISIPNQILRQPMKEISIRDIATPKIQNLIKGMKEMLQNTPDGVGLAAPQVGESLRLFLVSQEAEEIDPVRSKSPKATAVPSKTERTSNGVDQLKHRKWKYYVFINPRVKNFSKKKLEGAEGCLSVREKYGNVKRHEKITVEAYDEYGKKFMRGASRFFARVIQHELDHLEGILFIDKATEIFETKNEKNK